MYEARSRSIVLLDAKQGDVNGDGILDNVYLYGNQSDGPFADHITLIVQDGRSNRSTAVNLPNNAGYNARLFLGDFTKDRVQDILVSIDTGGSGGIRDLLYVFLQEQCRLRDV
ncbi:hypothetical protein [Cohnella rhizosphaerae]|uniref:VCBS repeat-containing protein n=1 Tax=Cohnella rhizosphaerae TaxID=1457232 RepID=A0A9X4QTD0_9BACL|nr:hypothetical protein [Cohnella rhizosphaerae]MDG0810580.1 hypothetical protein [Cohnella rhizosphaerae]